MRCPSLKRVKVNNYGKSCIFSRNIFFWETFTFINSIISAKPKLQLFVHKSFFEVQIPQEQIFFPSFIYAFENTISINRDERVQI